MIKEFLKRFFQDNTSKENLPGFFKEYLEKCNQPVDKNKQISECSFVVIDTETTGINPSTDKLISFGGLRLINNTIDLTQTVSFCFKDVYSIDRESIQIHGTLPNQPDGFNELEAIEKIISFVEDHIIVGHHIGFDVRMIDNLLKKHHFLPLQNLTIDTNHVKNRIEFPPFFNMLHTEKAFGLDELCHEYEIKTHQRHTAAGDSMLTALLFIKMIKVLNTRGVLTLKDFL